MPSWSVFALYGFFGISLLLKSGSLDSRQPFFVFFSGGFVSFSHTVDGSEILHRDVSQTRRK